MDELNAPLGQTPTPQRRYPIARLAGGGVAILLGLMVGGFALWAAIVRDPMGGEPSASAAIPPPQTAELPVAQTAKPDIAAAPPPGTQIVNIIDGSTGKRQEVVIGAPAGARPGGGGDSRLLETTQHGLIPRIAADGTRPADIYARKLAPEERNPDAPRIAIIVGGLGVSATATANALSKLPGAVTFAFTPYASGLDTFASEARDKGHEILLQVPMEPHDYPDSDPGPQTLLSSLPAEQNIDRLHWLFSRMQGYVGITNTMGARFTASEAALTPVLREVSRRGLIYVDDGSVPRSQAGQIAGANKLPYAKADVVIDATPSGAQIDSALARLETLARGGGVAVGYASALPGSIDRIAKWAKAAQARGVVLVPISIAAVRDRSS